MKLSIFTPKAFKRGSRVFVRILKNSNFKQIDLFQSGDACRHSAQSSDAVGQGGNQ